MNQVSPPMRFALAATLVLVLVWFAVLKPKNNADTSTPVATPATASTASSSSSTGKTNSALDQTAYAAVGKAKAAADAASADAHKQESQTGESGHEDAASASSKASATKSTAATTPDTKASAATKSTATGTAAGTAAKATGTAAKATPKLTHADRVILKIKKDLAAQKAVVVLIWSKTGDEDKVLYKVIKNKIDLRHGKVKTYFIPVDQVGRYDGLLSGLAIGQTPSTIVIAPNNQAKVIGGLTSAARLDRLTSSAVLIKPAAATK
ncbi:MAG: hypothetical protein AAGC46_09265 [Solirubrobacteraceae bacterium]|nr:hypothetical protein [Patulibacter sp.]